MNPNNEPLVTIITVVYNSVFLLEETILSVINQTYQNIEYIIIDGASNDGTIDIIKKYEDKISLWISEPDKGIYDAMNKGIDLANGAWINFMNAGDKFFNESIVESIFKTNNYEQYDIIYGNYEYINSIGLSIYKKARNLGGMWKFMPFCHQTLFMKINVIKEYYFNINNFAADHELIYKCYNRKLEFLKLDLIIATYLSGGVSERRGLESGKSRWQHVKNITPLVRVDLYYLYMLHVQQIRFLLRKYLPDPIKNVIIRLKNYNNTVPKYKGGSDSDFFVRK